ncbi:major capsid protein [Lamprobacter modestohalophilus]|uniref:major capsid protein n=1 Tax=Lamprobacter modestohalophilus TaxID=1064514 RepID=UPI002ADED77C|nr:major capsid protein [Lamprobacter modestohalophilus]MEA1052356.1 major capsid protein [Lamprobacter modestohalophilus]
MPIVMNPFAADGYSLAEMTQAINLIPNQYGRVNALGLFATEPLAQRTALVESIEGELRLLPTRPVGAPASVGSSDARKVRSFAVPHIPHNDVLLPEEIQGIRGFGLASGEDPMATLLARKLARMRAKHAQTLEYMRVNALRGITKDGSGETLYDWHAEFGITPKSVDFTFGTSTEDVVTKTTAVARHIEEQLKGETMSAIHALVSPEFFDALIKHKSVKEAYTFFQGASGSNPLRNDVRRGFPFGSIVFEEYFGTVTLANGSTERLIPVGEGIAFPLGTMETFTTYFAPANLMEAVGTYGEELYAYQVARRDDTGIDLYSQSNPLPIVKRPALCVRLHSSN